MNGQFRLKMLPLVILTLTVPAAPGVADSPTPPGQPEKGPGGKEYSHQGVVSHRYGQGATEYWIFEPQNPKSDRLPLVVFLHGWGATNPRGYGGWIEHIVRRGNIVIYPRYQENAASPAVDYASNAQAAILDGIKRLKGEGHIQADLKKVAFVGHSAGGALSAVLAARSPSVMDLPRPGAVMCVEPGGLQGAAFALGIPMEDLSKVPEKTLVIVLVGDQDSVVRDFDSRRIFQAMTQVPKADKNLVTVLSDLHGSPPLLADHFFPASVGALGATITPPADPAGKDPGYRAGQALAAIAARQSTTALDYHATWRLFDALCETAFEGTNREAALGNTPQQRFMGKWSDGVPVKELKVEM